MYLKFHRKQIHHTDKKSYLKLIDALSYLIDLNFSSESFYDKHQTDFAYEILTGTCGIETCRTV